jgi:carboxyl-terminal processing protease
VSDQQDPARVPTTTPLWHGTPPDPYQTANQPIRGQVLDQGVSQVIVTALLVILAFGAGWFGNLYVNRSNTVPANDPQLASIIQAYDTISADYVDPKAIDHKKMAYAAINAMVDSLGDTGHSRFETPEELAQENSSLQNQPTVGIGVLLSGGGASPIRIDEVFPNSAADGHLLPGDFIIAVNGADITGKTIDQTRPLILGQEGTTVTLTIKRAGSAQPIVVTLTRKQFTVPLVSMYLIPGLNIADIQLTQFAENPANTDSTDIELRTALKKAAAAGATGIILDLRENPGGYLDQAVLVASEFIPAGSGHNVFIQRSRTGQTPQAVQSGGLATATPLTVLVNENTASAAEIVTAAIAYNRPSVHVVGAHTFGTHTILTTVPLADGAVILLGTQGWLTPGGVNAHDTGGLQPDQPVALPASATEITPLVAIEEQLTEQQLLASTDTQLQQAIKDLSPASAG